MAKASTPGEGDGVEAFFRRCGLAPDTRHHCHALVRNLFPGASVKEANPQGFCSYTLCVGPDRIVQFRPPVHRLDVALAEAARYVYGDLAPETRLLTVMGPFGHDRMTTASGIHSDEKKPADEAVVLEDDRSCGAWYLDVISMAMMPGVSLAELRASSSTNNWLATTQLRQQRESIIADFARVIAAGWTRGRRPVSDPVVARLQGRVGSSLQWRLEKMAACLPPRFRPVARETLGRLDEIVELPWVLTHGDIVPANVMVQANDTIKACSLSGLLDWAEAEYLPFGVGLYGLEELLGETDASGWFSYYPEERELRELFWRRLEKELPDVNLSAGSHLRGLVAAAHTLGVLLWHGFAFDDGKLDRVVEEGKDEEEIRRLELFFRDEVMEHENLDDRNRKRTLVEIAGLAWRVNVGGAFFGVWRYLQPFSFGHTLFGKA